MAQVASSRRRFLGGAALGSATVAALADPSRAAAQAAGVKAADLPDLTIKEVRVYVLDRGRLGTGVTNGGYTQIASIVTNSGIEGNYTLANRYWHPDWSNLGWLAYANGVLRGKSVLDLPALTSQWEPQKRRRGQSSYASAIDNCLWDILGKAVGLPVYRILGAYRPIRANRAATSITSSTWRSARRCARRPATTASCSWIRARPGLRTRSRRSTR
jgi:L-alanine-DL-glutamate epimerase-like enolase superfamily enzyme